MCIRRVQNTIKYNYIIIVQVSQFDGFTTVGHYEQQLTNVTTTDSPN